MTKKLREELEEVVINKIIQLCNSTKRTAEKDLNMVPSLIQSLMNLQSLYTTEDQASETCRELEDVLAESWTPKRG